MSSLNLHDLDTRRHTVEWDGKSYPVSPITPRIVALADASDAADDPADRVRLLADAVAEILPAMSREIVDRFTMTQLYAIVKLAGTQVSAVEDFIADPNVPRSAVAIQPVAPLPPSDPAALTPSAA